MKKLNALVFGAGAIGTYIGGSLAHAGHHMVFIEQPDAADQLQKRGLRMVPKKGERPATIISPDSFIVTNSLTEAFNHGPFDLGIFALKSFDTKAAAEGMKAHAAEIPPILCLSNGVDNEPALKAVLGNDKVIAGTVSSSVTRLSIGEIVLEKERGVGIEEGHPLSLLIWEAMEEAALHPRLYPRAADMKWSKLLTNLLANATVAILDMTPRAVLSHPGLFKLEMTILREALEVMKAQHVRVVNTPKTPVRLLALAAHLPAAISRPLMIKAIGGGRGEKMPSFHIDLHAGRGKSEVEWLNGAVVHYGKKTGVPTPINHQLTGILSAMARGEIPLEHFRNQPDKLIDAVKGLH